MWKTSTVSLLLPAYCGLFMIVFLMKGTLSYGQVPPFNFGRVRPRHPIPFQESFRLSEDGKLISLAPDINLFRNSDSDAHDRATPGDTAGGLRAGERADRFRPFRVYRPYYERADWPKPGGVSPFDSDDDDGATPGDDSVGSSVHREDGGGGLPTYSDNGDGAAPIDYSAGSSVDREDGDTRVDRGHHDKEEYDRQVAAPFDHLFEANTCRHESITLYASWPGDKVPFYCQNVDAELFPGVLDVFSGSSCTGAPMPLSTLVPGAELLHRSYADGDVWTVSVKHLPAMDTTLCYQCRVTYGGTASVCKVIIIVKAAPDGAAACEVPALSMPALIFSAFLGALALTDSP